MNYKVICETHVLSHNYQHNPKCWQVLASTELPGVIHSLGRCLPRAPCKCHVCVSRTALLITQKLSHNALMTMSLGPSNSAMTSLLGLCKWVNTSTRQHHPWGHTTWWTVSYCKTPCRPPEGLEDLDGPFALFAHSLAVLTSCIQMFCWTRTPDKPQIVCWAPIFKLRRNLINWLFHSNNSNTSMHRRTQTVN